MGPPGAMPKGKPGRGKGKGKAAVPPMKGAAPPPPPRPVRGTVPGRGAPPRLMPPGAARVPMAPETPRAERLEGLPPPPPRRAQAMAALRRGKVQF